MNKLFQLLRLMRFYNLIIIAITQLMVAIFLVDDTTLMTLISNFKFHSLIISTLLIASSGYLINDYYDIEIDHINKPASVIIGHYVKRKEVLTIYILFNGIAIVFGSIISWNIFLINIFSIFLLFFYSSILKKLPLWGNLAISLLTGISVFIPYFLFFRNIEYIAFYAVFAFNISLIREIIKDLEDIKGDEKLACNTFPIAFGVPATKILIYSISLLLLLVFGVFINDWAIFYLFFITLFILIVFLCVKVYNADKKNNYTELSRLVKIIMLIGVSSMILVE